MHSFRRDRCGEQISLKALIYCEYYAEDLTYIHFTHTITMAEAAIEIQMKVSVKKLSEQVI